MNNDSTNLKCFYCGEKPVYQATFQLQESDTKATIQVCNRCYDEKVHAAKKKAASSYVLAWILGAIVTIIIISSIFVGGASILLAIGCSIGAVQVAFSAYRTGQGKEQTLSLGNNDPRKFTLLFGDDTSVKATFDKSGEDNEEYEIIYPGRKKGITILLWFLSYFGIFGFYHFYLRQYKLGVIKLGGIILCMAINVAVALIVGSGGEGIVAFVMIFVAILFIWGIVDIVKIGRTPAKSFGK